MTNVSVLIPVLNGEKYLRETLESVRSQDFVDEVIVVDNGSTDGTAQIIQNMIEVDSRIKYYLCGEHGISNALNFGLQVAKNEYIARIDSDDLMNAGRIRTQGEYLSRNSAVAVVASQITFIDTFGEVIGYSKYPTQYLNLIKNFSFRNPIAHPSVMYRKSVITRIGGYRSKFDGAEDLDLWLRVMKSDLIFVMNQNLTSYRVHENQVSGSPRIYGTEFRVRVKQFSEITSRPSASTLLFCLLQILRLVDLGLMRSGKMSRIRHILGTKLFRK